MPSFDIVSKLDMGEMKNAIDQAKREISGSGVRAFYWNRCS